MLRNHRLEWIGITGWVPSEYAGNLLITLEAIDEPWSRLMLAEVREFVISKPNLATRAPAIATRRKQVAFAQRTLTLAEAKDALGVGYNLMVKLAQEQDLYLVSPSGSGAPALLRAERVQALLETRSRLLTQEGVRDVLACCKATVNKLRSAGLLAHQRQGGHIMYPAHAVEALLLDLPGARLS